LHSFLTSFRRQIGKSDAGVPANGREKPKRKLFLAVPDEHTVHELDAASGAR
jgi:hypothetical protein